MPKPRPLDARRLWQLDRVGAVTLSPDGRHAVCAVTRPDVDANRSATSLWRLPVGGGRARRLTTGTKDGQPAWSPTGDRIAFVGRRDQEGVTDGAPQLYLLPASGGEARRASRFAPGIECFRWLPDGRRIVFAAWVWPDIRGAAAQAKRHQAEIERKETGYATGEAFYRHWDHHVPHGRALHLHLLDVDTGRVTDLFEGKRLELARYGAGLEDFDVSPDGRRIAFVHDPARQPRSGNRRALAEIDLRTRRVSPRVDEPDWDLSGPSYAPDGDRIAFAAAHVGRKHTALPTLALFERGGGWRLLGAAWDRDIGTPMRWAPDGDAVLYAAEDRGRRHLWRHVIGADVPEIVHEGGWVQDFDAAGDTLVVVADSAMHPPRVFARRAGAPAVRLERFNDALLAGVTLGGVREVQVTGALGEPVQMWLYLPAGFDAKKKHPVMQVIHGGPYTASGDGWSWRWNPHVLASRGHVVAEVNYHGSSGFGFAFRDSLIGRQGELELQDIEAGTDWLLAQRWADRKRVVAAGASYGGFLVAWMNGHVKPGRYRRYVCHAGVFDRVATFSADSYNERPKDLAARYWEDMPRVLAQSPATFARHMDTPTLVVHGALDYRVPDCNGLACYNSLKARGVEARLLWFPDEGHWVLKPRNSLQWYGEVMAWLAG